MGVDSYVSGVLIANKTKFVKDGFIECVIGGCSSCRVVGLSTLACYKGLRGLGSVRCGSGCSFIGKSVESGDVISGLIGRYSCIVGFTTRDRISEDVASPRVFVGSGILKARILLGTTGRFNIRGCVRVSASRICKDLKGAKCFARGAPLRPGDPCSTSGTNTSLVAETCNRAFNLPVGVAQYSGGCNPCRFPRGLVPLVVSGTLRSGRLPVCNSNGGIES